MAKKIAQKMESITKFLTVKDIIITEGQNQRKDFDKKKIKTLSLSMKENTQLHPLIVNLVDGKYYLVSGQRRLKAAISGKQKIIECKIFTDLNKLQVIRMMLAENRHRVDLNPIEEAIGFEMLLSEGIKIGEIAASEQVSVDKIAKRLDLLKLHPDVQIMMTRERNNLPIHQALIIKQLPADRQLEIAKKAAPANGQVLTEASTREIVDEILGPKLPGIKTVENETDNKPIRKAPKIPKKTASVDEKTAQQIIKSKPVPVTMGCTGKIGVNTDGQVYLVKPNLSFISTSAAGKNAIIEPKCLILDLDAEDLAKVAAFVQSVQGVVADKTSRKKKAVKKTAKKKVAKKK